MTLLTAAMWAFTLSVACLAIDSATISAIAHISETGATAFGAQSPWGSVARGLTEMTAYAATIFAALGLIMLIVAGIASLKRRRSI